MRLTELACKQFRGTENQALVPYALNGHACMALLMLYANPADALNPCDLNHFLDLWRTNIKRLSDELVRKVLLARRHCEHDRPRIQLSLTGQGERLLERCQGKSAAQPFLRYAVERRPF